MVIRRPFLPWFAPWFDGPQRRKAPGTESPSGAFALVLSDAFLSRGHSVNRPGSRARLGPRCRACVFYLCEGEAYRTPPRAAALQTSRRRLQGSSPRTLHVPSSPSRWLLLPLPVNRVPILLSWPLRRRWHGTRLPGHRLARISFKGLQRGPASIVHTQQCRKRRLSFDVVSYYKNHTVQYTMSAYHLVHSRCLWRGK